MENKEILEGNKLIAQFDNKQLGLGSINDYKGNIPDDIAKKFKYHSSWDWLMPVVEKIENITNNSTYLFKFHTGKDHCAIVRNDLLQEIICVSSVPKNKIESYYKAVVEFIKWYNKNKK